MLPSQTAVVLLSKHGLRISIETGRELFEINNAIRSQAHLPGCLSILDEVVRTNGDLSNQIRPRYRFTERYDDLKRCLLLDGFLVRGRELVPIDPSISDSLPIEDDLVAGIKAADLDPDGEVVGKLNDSTEAFRRNPPDYNACLINARVALEAIARDVARRRFPSDPSEYDPTKWGFIVAYLRKQGFFSAEEKRVLLGQGALDHNDHLQAQTRHGAAVLGDAYEQSFAQRVQLLNGFAAPTERRPRQQPSFVVPPLPVPRQPRSLVHASGSDQSEGELPR